MEQNTNEYYTPSEEANGEDLKQLIKKYLRYWPWFALGVVVMLVIAYLYTRYTAEVYQTSTEIKILEEKDSGLDLTGLQGASTLFDMSKINLENEVQILKSRRLLHTVEDKLNLSTSYYSVGNIKNSELWINQTPFKVEWKEIPQDSLADGKSPLYTVEFTSKTTYNIRIADEDAALEASIDEDIKLKGLQFSLTLNPKYEGNFDDLTESPYAFRYTLPSLIVGGLSSEKIIVEPVGEQSEILKISLQGENKHKNEAILNTLTEQFNRDGVKDKQLISERTGEFVDERLQLLVQELDTVESGLVDYKQENRLVTIESNAEQLFEKEAGAEIKRFEIETQKAVTKEFKQELEKEDGYGLLPANIGIEDSDINKLTEAYNESVLLREKLLVSSTPQNPLVVSTQEKLDRIKQNIFRSVNAYLNSLDISLKSFQEREGTSSGELNTLPKKEKELRSIYRQQEIKEKLYLFLLQKREEAALQYATTSPIIKMVDYAYTQVNPVAPKKKIIYLAAFLLGLLIPFGLLYVKFLLDTKISSKEQVKRVLKGVSIIAEIPQLAKEQISIVRPNDRSVVSEAFRILRTNISYFKPPKLAANKGQVIYVTSSTKGEGKTFTSINLASTLASTNKKVLLIGCDLRNPQIHNYINKDKNNIGLSSFLFDNNVFVQDLIVPEVMNIYNLDVVLSGNIPPNPAELLLNGRYEELIEEVRKNYDYVVVDTAPTVLVTDTLLISKWADITVYVARANHTEIKILQHIKELSQDHKLNNIGLVLNGVDEKGGYGYNYGYGYGYGEEFVSPSRWKFWKKR